jgi:hypothetical protein
VQSVTDVRAAGRGAGRSVSLSAVAPNLIGGAVVVAAFVVYLLCNRQFSAGRGDFFYLADAFLHGRTWLLGGLGPNDNVDIGGRVFVPFAPFPAFLLVPLVALVGPQTADTWQPIVNAAFAALDVGLLWWLATRIGVRSIGDRIWLALLWGFSTAIWWVTTRGGVWHTGHLVASMLTLLALIELFGRRRMALVGLLGGFAFLSRAPVVFALPFYGLWSLIGRRIPTKPLGDTIRALPWREWIFLAIGFLPSLAFFLWYNAVRFGSPFESGYELATLPAFLEVLRAQGLFSTAHLGMNIDYLFLHMPTFSFTFPFLRPDGLGMSIFLTSPALLYALRAPWRDQRTWVLAGAFVATLIPSLLYYGGGWLQYGYRYALDSIPFAMAMAAMAAARNGRIGWGWKVLICFGIVINAIGVYWAYNLH